jgi:hypothetical protein
MFLPDDAPPLLGFGPQQDRQFTIDAVGGRLIFNA